MLVAIHYQHSERSTRVFSRNQLTHLYESGRALYVLNKDSSPVHSRIQSSPGNSASPIQRRGHSLGLTCEHPREHPGLALHYSTTQRCQPAKNFRSETPRVKSPSTTPLITHCMHNPHCYLRKAVHTKKSGAMDS